MGGWTREWVPSVSSMQIRYVGSCQPQASGSVYASQTTEGTSSRASGLHLRHLSIDSGHTLQHPGRQYLVAARNESELSVAERQTATLVSPAPRASMPLLLQDITRKLPSKQCPLAPALTRLSKHHGLH